MVGALPFLHLLLSVFLAFPAAVAAADPARLEAAKNVGLAALEEGKLEEAARRFEEVRRLAPAEPLGWANGAVAAMRSKDYRGARRLLDEAVRRASEDARVRALEGLHRELAGDAPAAVQAYEEAVRRDPSHLQARWAAARLLAEKVPGGRPRALPALEAAIERSPANVFLLMRLAQWRSDGGDSAGAAVALRSVAAASGDGDPKLARYLEEAGAALRSADGRNAGIKLRIVENLLRSDPRYQQARRDVEPGVVGIPLEDWTPGLAALRKARTGENLTVTFAGVQGLTGLGDLRGLSLVRAGGRDGRDLIWAGEDGIVPTTPRDGRYTKAAALPGRPADLEVADLDNSGDLDLVTAGALWFGSRRVPIPEGDRALPVDFDSDGDLDIYLSGRPDRLLRNNLDGTWRILGPEAGLPAGLSSVHSVAADVDRDGDPDLVLVLRGGGLLVLDNLRGGRFEPRDVSLSPGQWTRSAAGDLDADGRLDLVVGSAEKSAVLINHGDGTFLPARELPAAGLPILFDFDNDGDLDLLLVATAGSQLLRNDGTGAFAPTGVTIPGARDAAPVDFDGDGDTDLALVLPDGRAALVENRGGNAHGWIDVVLEGLPTGSAKVNRFGYGSEIEVKAQDLYAYRIVAGPVTRIGLGPRRRAEVLRIVWTNGIPQNAVDPPARTVVKEVQQLKGSCPFLYVYDGTRWHFVTDALGASPLGLLYDGVHQAPANTREWLVVSGEQLRPSRGELALDFTEELWETAYLDVARLYALDHPAGTEMVSNDRMAPPPFPPKKLYSITHPWTPRATDEKGRDRTAEIRAVDGDVLGGFAPTRYQGIVAAHDLLLELPRAQSAARVMLYLTGWIFYSDTSIQVSLSQGAVEKPFGPVLEVRDGRGGWKTALPSMGFPAGKTKTMAVDLSTVLDRGDPRVRIRTNLEIYWDRIAYTADDPPPRYRLTEVLLRSAELFFRGFSLMTREGPEAPHVFLHDQVETAPRWADMAGLYTGFGDVRSLLTRLDDRYVVMKGGDAIRLLFAADRLPEPPAGWRRDWLVELDGWDKDADKNTVAGQTVEPLPFHGQDDARYGEAQPFPDEASHRKFRRETLTRRGGPEEFRDYLRRLTSGGGK
jgi:tetratricopeptide (TPR) repeat protein